MKNLILLSAFIFVTIQLFSQNNRYWVNGSGNWSDTAHWSLTSGGNAGADIPTKEDNVFIDENSAVTISDAVIIKSPTKVNSFNIYTPVVLKGKGSIEIYGSIKVSKKADLHKFKGDLIFASSNNQNIDISTDLNSNIIFDGKNGSWSLTSDITTRKNIYLDRGYVSTNNKTVEANSFIATGNSNRGLELGKSDIIVANWDFANSENLNFDAAESTIIIPNEIQKSVKGGGLYYNSIKSGKPSSKGLSATITPQAATCPVNSVTGITDDGEINVVVTGGGGSYDIVLLDGVPTIIASVSGVASYNFTKDDIGSGALPSGNYSIGYREGADFFVFEGATITPDNLLVDINVTDDVTCFGGDDLELTATVSGGNGGYTYAWKDNYDASYTNTNPVATVGPSEYEVTVTDVKGCSHGDGFIYWAGDTGDDYDNEPTEVVVTGAIPDNSCENLNNGSIDVTASGGTGPYTYAAIIAATEPLPGDYGGVNPIPNLTGNITYHVWAKDSKGCPNEYSSTVSVGETPEPSANNLSNASICESDTYTFSGVNAQNGTISWASADGKGTWTNGTTDYATFEPHADHYGGTIVLTITVTGNGNCNNVQKSMTLTVHNNPIADLSGNATDICENADLALDGNPSGGSGIFTHLWTDTGAQYLDNDDVVDPTFNSTAYGSFNLTYTVTDNNSCSGSDAMTVDVQDGPSVNAGDPDNTCEGVAYTVPVNHASVTNATVAWTENGTGSLTNATTLTPTYTPGVGETGDITLTLTATGIGACTGNSVIDNMTLTINPLPVPTITGSDNTCLNSSETYTTEASMTGYIWTVTDGTIDSGQGTNSVSITWATQVAPKVTVTYTNGNSCGAAVPTEKSVTVNNLPTSDLSINATTACQNTDLALDGNPSGGSGTYSTHLWTGTGAAHLDNTGSETPTFNCPTPASYNLTYTVTDNNGCKGSDNMAITVNTGPSVTVGADDASCQDSPYTVPVGHSNGTDGTFAWTENGTGSFTSGGATLTPTYTPGAGETGDVSFTLTVTGAGVCAGSSVFDDMTLTLNALPVPTITGNFNLCVNTSTTYTTEAGMTGYSWNVVAGNITSGAGTDEIIVLWTSTVTPSVSVTYTNGNLCSAAAPTVKNVTVHNSPSPDLSVNSNQACENSDLVLDGNPSGGSGTYSTHLWTDAGAIYLDDINIQGPKFNSSTTGNFDLTYTVTDNNGCEGSDNITITVNPGPTAAAGIDDATCMDVAYTIPASQATATNGTIAWTEDGTGSITSGGTSLTPTYTPGVGELGDVKLTLTVTGTGACIASSAIDDMILTIHSLPNPTITGDNSACLGTSKNYSTEAGMTGYVWTIVDGTIDSGQGTDAISVTWTSQVAPKITVNYNNANSCSAAAPTVLVVIVNDNPVADLSANATTVCEYNDLVLDGNPSGGSGTYSTHLWTDAGVTYLDDINIQGPTFNSDTPNNYNLTYTVTDDNGCVGSDNMTITVTDGPSAFAGIDTTLCRDAVEYSIIDAVALNSTVISWANITVPANPTGGFGVTVNDQNPVYTFTADDNGIDTLELVMTVSNATCSDVTDTVLVIKTPELVASVGGASPYLISPTTKIEVKIWATHENVAQLGFYLQAPDGVTRVRLYKHFTDGTGCSLTGKPDIDELTFTTESANSLNFCNASIVNPITGTFACKDLAGWSAIDGKDPAQGGWSLVIEDVVFNKVGTLLKTEIVFLDKNQQGEDKYIIFSSGDINYPINDHSETIYTVPIGLRTSCFGVCDARAIVSVTGGTAPYVSYLWDDGQTNDTVDLCGGTHTVTVTDSKGCTSVGSVWVIEPDSIVLAIDSTDISCYGDSTGMVKVIASAGAGVPFTYLWDDGDNSTTAQVDDLPAGTYTVIVYDKNMCTADTSVIINQPLTPISVTGIATKTNCGIIGTGEIDITPTGGTPALINPPYTFEWYEVGSPGIIATTEDITDLTVGHYAVFTFDSLMCSSVDTFKVEDLGDMEVTLFAMDTAITCNGANDGTARVEFTGGTANGDYAFEWKLNGGVVSTDSLLTPTLGDSTYFVTIVDQLTTCSVDSFYIVPQPDSLKMSIVNTSDVLCFSDSSGIAEVTGIGGTGVYTYLWHDGNGYIYSSVATADKLPYGYTYVDIQDVNNCSITDSVFIDQPVEMSVQFDFTKALCGESQLATILAVVSGGNAPYNNYVWTNEAGDILSNEQELKDVGLGTYYIVVSDANICNYNDSVKVLAPVVPELTIVTSPDIDCGTTDGWAQVTAVGGNAPFTYNWFSDSDPAALIVGFDTDSAQQLWVDKFVVEVTDASGCIYNDTAIIEDNGSLDFNIKTLSLPTCMSALNGSATIQDTTGGTSPYSFAWSNGETNDTAFALPVGITTVVVTGNLGCKAVKSVEMSDNNVLAVTIQKLNDISQGGDDCNGFAKADVIGGIEPYTYAWTKAGDPTFNETTQLINNLCEGWYYVTITDALVPSCELIDSVFIADDSLRYDTLLLQHVVCFGDSTGQVTLQAHGGFPGGYNYVWANKDWSSYPASDSTGASLSNLKAGRYYFTITDNGSSVISDSIDILQTDLYIPDFVVIETNCSNPTGIISINETGSTGGTAPFSYEWANDDWSSFPLPDSMGISIANLNIGVYTAIITDANGCKVIVDSVEMKDNSSFALNPTVYTPVRCYDFSNGSIYSRPSNGVEPYNFSWATGQTTDTIYNLVAGDYTVTVTDADGCIRQGTIGLSEPEEITFTLKDTVKNICYTDCSGSIEVDNVMGGNNNVNDAWNYIIYENSNIVQEGPDSIFRDLCTSIYNIKVEDKVGCFSDPLQFVFYSESPQVIFESYNTIQPASCNLHTDDGELSVKIAFGYFDQVSPSTIPLIYKYKWNDDLAHTGDTTLIDTLFNASAGLNTVEVIIPGVNDCAATSETEMSYKYGSGINSAYILGSYLQSDYLCPSIPDKLIVSTQVSGTVLRDTVIWSSSSPSSIIEVESSDVIVINSDSSQTYSVNSRAYYTETDFCYDNTTIYVYRYEIDSLIATSDATDNQLHLGNEIVLSVDEPDVLPDTITGIFVEHNYLWQANTDKIEWLTGQDDYTATAKPEDNTIFVASDSIIITSNKYSTKTCLLSDTLSIEVLPDFDPPKGFTPNGDGMYDEWDLPGIGGYDNVVVQIYNRWGGIVWEFTGENYDTEKWKGENSNGKQLPSGTYYFFIKYGNEGEDTKTLTGPITIIR